MQSNMEQNDEKVQQTLGLFSRDAPNSTIRPSAEYRIVDIFIIRRNEYSA